MSSSKLLLKYPAGPLSARSAVKIQMRVSGGLTEAMYGIVCDRISQIEKIDRRVPYLGQSPW
jgi:hypothetical protein